MLAPKFIPGYFSFCVCNNLLNLGLSLFSLSLPGVFVLSTTLSVSSSCVRRQHSVMLDYVLKDMA